MTLFTVGSGTLLVKKTIYNLNAPQKNKDFFFSDLVMAKKKMSKIEDKFQHCEISH